MALVDKDGCKAWCSHVFTEEELHNGTIREQLAYYAPKLLGHLEKAGAVEV